MARSGLYKSDVKKARDALIAQGKNPSVDALRVALGNTGSKTTIHKYLKELEEEDDSATGKRASISEALQDLVERLAARLQEEAAERIDAMQRECDAKIVKQDAVLAAVQQENVKLQTQLRDLEAVLEQKDATLASISAELHRESTVRHIAEQQAVDLVARLAENEAHRQSLEEKHQHAREALEHYRQSIKEQREADARRHEQQVQQVQAEFRLAQQTIAVKQEETTKLNQEGVRLITELGHVRQAHRDEQKKSRALERELDSLRPIKIREEAQALQLLALDTHIGQLKEQLATAQEKQERATQHVHGIEVALAQAKATTEARQNTIVELRGLLIAMQKEAPSPSAERASASDNE